MNDLPRIRALDDGRRAALLIVECQIALIDGQRAMVAPLAREVADRGILPRVARLADAVRAAGVAVIHCGIRIDSSARGFAVASPLQAMMARNPDLRDLAATRFHPDVAPAGADVVILREHGITAFHGSNLEDYLRAHSVESLILTGVSTDLAIYGTAIEAVNRGFGVVVAEDCVAAVSAERHRHAIQHLLPPLAGVADAAAISRRFSNRHG